VENTPVSEQLNLRLSKPDSDRLAAHAFLRRVQPTVLAREVIVQFLDANDATPGLAKALSALAESDSSKRGKSDDARPLRGVKAIP
jgi:hypothetical protein